MHVNENSSTPPHNLPAALSSFVGRGREMAEIVRLVQEQRLVTLTGAGGSGKTRLALEVARGVQSSFSDGAWLVELASLADGALVPQAVASALGVSEQGGRPLLATLAESLQSRHMLLVVDNCEHLVLACAQLAESLLQACPSLTILATSREALAVQGEVIRIVPPLSLPRAENAGLAPESEAVQLFVARAAAAAPDFELNPQNAPAVAQICLRLDGMPLAIELAAARVRSLSVHQIAELLKDRFQLLTGGSRTAPARQRTLEAALEWSYGLLPEDERRLLQRLSVFAGGCTLEAAEAVCAAEAEEARGVRDLLAHLVDKSLVVAERSPGEVRYRLLETIREYARRKHPQPDAGACMDRHLEYYTRWAESMTPILLGPELARGMLLVRSEHDNLRAALAWSESASGKAQLGLRLAAAAWNYWRVEGFHSEGRRWLSELLALPEAQAPTLARALALVRAALHAFYQSDYPACKSLAEESLRIFRGLGKNGRNGEADCLELLAEVASETGDYDTATALYERALSIYQEVGDLMGIGDTLKMMGWHAMRSGDYELARPRLEQGLEYCRRTGEQRHISSALSGLGELAIRTGHYEEARRTLNESLAISRTTGERWNIAINLGSLAWVALLEKDYRRMAELLRESLSIRAETGDRGGVAWCLEKLGLAAVQQGKLDTAARLFGAAAAVRRPSGSRMDRSDQPDYDRALTALQKALGVEEFARQWEAGDTLDLDEAIELGLSATAPPPPAEMPGGLTARELEVAGLIAKGKSNREIAAAMTVGVKTVETYVTRILNKLGLDSRVQVATWAMEQGLVAKENG